MRQQSGTRAGKYKNIIKLFARRRGLQWCFPYDPMDYNASKSDYALTIGLWRVFVPSERAWDRTVRDLPGMLEPEKTSFYRPRVANKTGHQIDLMHWSLTMGEDELPFSYPDW